ncbi:p53-induced death domain-containing protein 1-like isoform X2 [Ptychodera flava]
MERLKKLRNLTLDDNEFSVLPASVTKLASLKVLSLKGNKLKDLPPEIAQLTNLKELNISSNKITAKVLLKLMNMTSLCQLNIGDNAIRYLPFEVLSRLGQLNKIYMQDNPVKYPPLEVCLLGVEEMKKYQKANPIPDILTRLESEDEDYTLYEETVFLFGNDKEEQKLVFLNNITLTVPPGVVKENVEVKASLEGGEIFRPKLKENEAFESEIIDLQPRLMNFKKPALLEIPIGIDNSRNIMVLSSDDGIRWSTHLTNKGKNGVSIKITKLAMFAVVSSQVQEDFDMEPQGCTFKSTVCKDVTITFPAGAVGTKDKLSVQIMQVSRDAVSASFEENSGLENEMSFSPVVCVTSGRKQGSFKKSVVLSLPRPPKLPSGKSDIRIVADKSDTDDWQDVTEEVKPSVSGNVVTCVVQSFSKYGAVNSSQRERGRVARHATKVYNNAKRGINKAKILLLQRIQNPKQMVVSVLEAKKLSEHIERFEGMGYGSYRQSGIPYSRDILLRRRQRISFEVSDGFEIYLGMKQLVFYPNQECFTEVNVRSLKSANDNILEGSLKFFMKKSPDTGRKPGESESGQIAELLFDLGKCEVLQAHIVTQAKQVPKKLKRSISYVTSTLTKSGKDWKSFGEKLGMSVDELEAIEAENSEERDCVHQLFLRWLDKEQDGATNERIIETLRKEGYLGMAEIVQKLLNKDALQSAIEIVAELLPPKEWKQFGRSKKGLNLSTQDIEHIDTDYQQDGIREKKYQMLLLWQNRKGPAATVSKLVDSLDKCELKELADKLRNECRE